MRHTLFKLSFEGSQHFLGGQFVEYPSWTSYPIHLRRAQTVFFTCTFSEEILDDVSHHIEGENKEEGIESKKKRIHFEVAKIITRMRVKGDGQRIARNIPILHRCPWSEKENKTIGSDLFSLFHLENMHFSV